MSQRRMWRAHDIRFTKDPVIEDLGERFGPAGPLTVSVLLDLAKLQHAGGTVRATYREISHAAFLEGTSQAQEIVAAAAQGGVIQVDKDDGRHVIASFPRWRNWQPLTSTERSQRARGTGRDAMQRDGTDGDAEQRSACHATGTETDTSSLRSEESLRDSVEPALNGDGSEHTKPSVSELFAYWQQQCGHAHAKLTNDRRTKIRARLAEGYTPEQIRCGIDGAARAAFVNEDGKRFDDIELICRSGSKLENFIERADAQRGDSPAGFIARLQERKR